jgi:hypothetical protein
MQNKDHKYPTTTTTTTLAISQTQIILLSEMFEISSSKLIIYLTNICQNCQRYYSIEHTKLEDTW